ncbi:hypothetical protein LCGC14_2162370 [marine sediment metagenome]|uniref:Uncharacterized protein n=1 Tax=marine sediment metagenome TaxID=412755 RepID=A0A0F9G544_9ZZZZ
MEKIDKEKVLIKIMNNKAFILFFVILSSVIAFFRHTYLIVTKRERIVIK